MSSFGCENIYLKRWIESRLRAIYIKVGSNATGTAADTPPFLFSWNFGGRTTNYAGVSEPMSWYHAEVECNLR